MPVFFAGRVKYQRSSVVEKGLSVVSGVQSSVPVSLSLTRRVPEVIGGVPVLITGNTKDASDCWWRQQMAQRVPIANGITVCDHND